jgi:hypothetical protein
MERTENDWKRECKDDVENYGDGILWGVHGVLFESHDPLQPRFVT